MKSKILVALRNSIIAFFVIFAVSCTSNRSKKFVILSTNDMHAQIEKFPALATAIEQCRDSIDVILVDAGDRWTGNAYVDLVEHYTPIYELMNLLKYDVAIYGNHEFDKGQAYVAAANRQAQFPIIGANIISDTTSFPQPAPHTIVEAGGKKIGFVGVVSNYEGDGHPAGKGESYEGLTFLDPHQAAGKYGYLADECDMLVMVSHCGLERDIEFAQSEYSKGFDQIISAHSHDEASERVNGKLVSQTGSRLKNVGATVVEIDSKGEVKLSYRNVPLADYTPDQEVTEMVAQYLNNEDLNAPIGRAASDFTAEGLRNLFAETIAAKAHANIGIYHVGGVRLTELKAGEISVATILNLEPFSSYIANTTMSVAQLRELIMTKFNDKRNVGESHAVDLIATTPYTIITDQSGEAVDVIFPDLDEKRQYRVAMGDYIFKTYGGLHYSKGSISETLITETLSDHISKKGEISPNNVSLQSIEKQKKE